MSVFSSAQITKFTENGEEDIVSATKCISFRLALDIVSGTSQYLLPEYLLSIQQITWKGWRLNPMPQRDLRDSLMSGTQGGRPFWYIYNGIGQRKIQLFGVPQESIIADQTHLYDTGIGTQCIVEMWRQTDFSTYILPAYIRRRIIRAYVMKECYAYEGKGQNLKAAAYWTKKYEGMLEDYRLLLMDLHNKPRNLNSGITGRENWKKAPPILPISRYGVGVDW